MKKLFALLTVFAVSFGIATDVLATENKQPKTSACSIMVVEHYIDEDGFDCVRITRDEECSKLHKFDNTATVDPQFQPKILPASPLDPSGSFKVYDPWGQTTKTYIPQDDGTLKVRPW